MEPTFQLMVITVFITCKRKKKGTRSLGECSGNPQIEGIESEPSREHFDTPSGLKRGLFKTFQVFFGDTTQCERESLQQVRTTAERLVGSGHHPSDGWRAKQAVPTDCKGGWREISPPPPHSQQEPLTAGPIHPSLGQTRHKVHPVSLLNALIS